MTLSELSLLDKESILSKINDLEKIAALSNAKREVYENGDARLYYSLQRKMSEIAKSLNSQDLSTVDLVSKSDATFDRIFKLLEKCESISSSANALGVLAGVTGNEEKDVAKKPFVDTIAERRN